MRNLSLLILFTVGFAFPSTLFTSCCDINCEPPPAFFDVTGIRSIAHNIRLDDGSFTMSRPDQVVAFEAYSSTTLFFDVDFVAAIPSPGRAWEFNLLPTAHAWTCECGNPQGFRGAKTESLISVVILTLDDFDTEFPAGADVTELFDLNFDTGSTDLLTDPFLNMTLTTQPDNIDPIQFQVELILSSGERYAATTQPLGFR